MSLRIYEFKILFCAVSLKLRLIDINEKEKKERKKNIKIFPQKFI